MKSYIAQVKGEAINWAKAVTSIAREKAQRKEVHILKSGGSVELFHSSGAREVLHKLDINVMCEQPTYTLPTLTTRNLVICNQSLCNWHATNCRLQLSWSCLQLQIRYCIIFGPYGCVCN